MGKKKLKKNSGKISKKAMDLNFPQNRRGKLKFCRGKFIRLPSPQTPFSTLNKRPMRPTTPPPARPPPPPPPRPQAPRPLLSSRRPTLSRSPLLPVPPPPPAHSGSSTSKRRALDPQVPFSTSEK
ncbi:hypothetical protein TorRG33x02_185670 [Trema orientale]|uniref:Uncharacterized protein n=1 Tax=Trema orientale TaxID=63057 RepID=A0A2P5EJJ8_TREOI|nr:hypothetical protein TorRG33x02_185670 [Trema orientale]